MQLGIFPWMVLSLYVAFFHPRELQYWLHALPDPRPRPARILSS
jgi:hypothetical protein